MHSEIAAAMRDPKEEPWPPERAARGSWGVDGAGDRCLGWYERGPTDAVRHGGGGGVFSFSDPPRFAHQVSHGGVPATLQFRNEYRHPVPLGLTVMVWGDLTLPREELYPRARVTVSSFSDGTAGAAVTTHQDEDILVPLHPDPAFQSWHVPHTFVVGHAIPGTNVVTVEPLDQVQKPLRITGLVMCPDCEEDRKVALAQVAGWRPAAPKLWEQVGPQIQSQSQGQSDQVEQQQPGRSVNSTVTIRGAEVVA